MSEVRRVHVLIVDILFKNFVVVYSYSSDDLTGEDFKMVKYDATFEILFRP